MNRRIWTTIFVLAIGINAALDAQVQTPPARPLLPWQITEVHPAGPIDFVPPAGLAKDKADAIQKVGVKVYTDREYVANGGEQRALDLYVPQNSGGKKMPVIVFFHGSPNSGTKEGWLPALMMLPRGYVVVSANYRLLPTLFYKEHLAFPEQLYDAKAAIRWVRAHAAEYNIDPDRLGVWGHSWGGYLVNLLGTTNGLEQFEGTEGNLNFSSKVEAVISWSGLGDYVAQYLPDVEAARNKTPNLNPRHGNLITNIGGLDVATEQKAAEASPQTYVRAGLPPFLVMAGAIDDIVPPALNQQPFAEALKKAGVDCTYFVVPGQGHGFGGPAVDQQVYDFLAKNLPAAK